ncbi:M23 family metallopeptidase [Chloroflexi bacterium TSY]|nr:M23 family metallopeptidase [Chloroflexi bacterium TSY]
MTNKAPYLVVECRPSTLIAARYDEMPFPIVTLMQEIVFDLGLTALHGAIELTGIALQGYNGHQLLFEQRWPGRIIQQHIGDADLVIPVNTGLAIRSLHIMLHGYEPLTMLEVRAVGKTVVTSQQESSVDKADAKPPLQTVLQIPVRYSEQKTNLHFPLEGSWWAIQGADWSDQHKQEVLSQTYAIDFVKLDAENRFFRGAGTELEEHHSWDQPVYATAGGKVAFVCFDMPDLKPGQVPDAAMFHNDPRRILGNAVAISHANGEFSYYGHLQQASIQVNEEQLIKRRTLLGRVGNSGHSPGPHLHFHLMEGPNLLIDQGLPAKFSHFEAGGQYFERPTYIPTRMIVHGKRKE